jgi:GDSL-like Lipase/Acylhydrolase family
VQTGNASLGTMNRLTIFAKGNLDVRDSLHSFRVGDRVEWNGINEIVRIRFPDTLIRVRHETWGRSDALLGSDGTVPDEVAVRRLPLDPFSAEAQFSRVLFEIPTDVIVLSVQPDLMNAMVRHRRNGYLLHPYNLGAWPASDRLWLSNEFDWLELLDVDTAMINLAAIVRRIRERSAAPILAYNVSSMVPGDSVHCHEGTDDIFSTRIRRFNLGLIELSRHTGISVIDIDSIVARAGADRVKLDPIHLTAEGNRLVAAEVVRVLDDLGCFSPMETM